LAVPPSRPSEPAAPPLTAAGAKTDFDGSIVYLATALANKLSIGASRWLRKHLRIGLMEWRVLALLAVEGECSPARIGQVAGVDKSVVSRAAQALEADGLIEIAATASAGRQTALRLTQKGLDLHDRAIHLALLREDRLLEGFSEAERVQLTEQLKRMTANLGRVFDDPD
jgi:DNA-binding MarR family transcriptional regulator